MGEPNSKRLAKAAGLVDQVTSKYGEHYMYSASLHVIAYHV